MQESSDSDSLEHATPRSAAVSPDVLGEEGAGEVTGGKVGEIEEEEEAEEEEEVEERPVGEDFVYVAQLPTSTVPEISSPPRTPPSGTPSRHDLAMQGHDLFHVDPKNKPTSVYLEHATIAGTALVQSSVLKSWRRKFLIVKHHYLYIFQVDTPACVELLQKPDCLQSGWMTKLGHIVKNWKRRYFVLTRGCLYYFKGPDDWGTTGQIPLLNVHAERVQHQVSPLCFAVITDHPNASRPRYLMYPDDPFECEMWLRNINYLSSNGPTNRTTTTTSSSYHPSGSTDFSSSDPTELTAENSEEDRESTDADPSPAGASWNHRRGTRGMSPAEGSSSPSPGEVDGTMTFSVFASRLAGDGSAPVLTIPDHWSFDPWGPDTCLNLLESSMRVRSLDGHPCVLEITQRGKKAMLFQFESQDTLNSWHFHLQDVIRHAKS